jgi:hypothetical protein
MCRPERIDPRIIHQNIHMAVSEFDRSFGHFAHARCVPKVRGNEIRFASCSTDLRNCLLSSGRIATYDDDMDAKLSQFIGCRPANPACSSGYQRRC